MVEPFVARMRITWEGECRKGWHEPWRLLYDSELVITSAGPFTLQIGQESHTMEPGSIAIVPPATRHQSFVPDGPGTFRHCIHFTWNAEGYAGSPPLMCMDWEPFDEARAQRVPPSIRALLPLVRGPEQARGLAAIADLLIREVRAHSGNAELLLNCLLRGLLEPLDSATGRAFEGKTERAVFAVKHLIDVQYHRPLNYRDFCRLVDLSPSYLCQAFRRLTGLSPTEYLLQIRIEHAKRLLREPDRQIAEVGRAVGVPDPNYFARLFRRKTGRSPSEYLRSPAA